MEKTEIGTLYPAHGEKLKSGIEARPPMFLKNYVGEAKAESGERYTMSNSVPGGCIVIYSEQTKRTFRITMEEAVKLAVARGIDSKELLDDPK